MGILKRNNTNKIVDDKSKSFIQNATDTFREVALIFLIALLLGGVSYSFFEHKPLVDGLVWALTTGFTIGYNDILPTTVGGDVTARILMTFSVYVIIPLITALMAFKMLKPQFDEIIALQQSILESKTNKRTTKAKAKPDKVK